MIQDLIESNNIDSVNLGLMLLISEGGTSYQLKDALSTIGENFSGHRVNIKYSMKKPCWESRRRRKMKKSTTFALVKTIAQNTCFVFKHRPFSRQKAFHLSNISFECVKEIIIKTK